MCVSWIRIHAGIPTGLRTQWPIPLGHAGQARVASWGSGVWVCVCGDRSSWALRAQASWMPQPFGLDLRYLDRQELGSATEFCWDPRARTGHCSFWYAQGLFLPVQDFPGKDSVAPALRTGWRRFTFSTSSTERFQCAAHVQYSTKMRCTPHFVLQRADFSYEPQPFRTARGIVDV